MKNIIFLFSCILITLTSCKKKDVAPANTISVNIDGVNESFANNAYAKLGPAAKTNSMLIIYGTNGTGSGTHAFGINLSLNESITTGSYTSGSNNTGLVSIQYNNGQTTYTDTYANNINEKKCTVVITSISDTNIQGTFSGILINQQASSKTITGKFNLTIK